MLWGFFGNLIFARILCGNHVNSAGFLHSHLLRKYDIPYRQFNTDYLTYLIYQDSWVPLIGSFLAFSFTTWLSDQPDMLHLPLSTDCSATVCHTHGMIEDAEALSHTLGCFTNKNVSYIKGFMIFMYAAAPYANLHWTGNSKNSLAMCLCLR